jgi:hypothetical protein
VTEAGTTQETVATTGAPAGRGTPRPSRSRRLTPPSVWEHWDDERLLDLRLCDLDITIEGTPLEDRIAQLYRELDGTGLAFRPHVWLSDEWFTPDGVPGIAVPFYLAHPRLARLELSQMLEVEGGTAEWCLRILRHEAGHAIENAYRLRRRGKRQRLFGPTSIPYPDSYAAKPYSRSFVVHLDAWYAQSHPDEDFAETFAVWLTPGSDWRSRYARWPALRKLEYMDDLMRELAGRPPLVANHQRIEPISGLRRTLRTHYRKRRVHYGVVEPDVYDRDLRQLFSDAPELAGRPTAAAFLTRVRREVRRLVRRWTGERQYVIDQVLHDMIERCRELGLRLAVTEEQARVEFAVLLTVQTMNYLHSGRHRFAL